MAPDDLLAVVRERGPGYVETECVVHLLRRIPDGQPRLLEGLYREMARRIDSGLPRPGGDILQNVHLANARDAVRDAFNLKLARDRRDPGPDLDYYEVMFADALSALRTTALRTARRAEERSSPIESDPATNQPSEAVERAAGSFDVAGELLSEDPIYRSRVLAAIDELPPKQRRVIEMILQGMPLDCADGSILSIRKVLGVAEKTVRNRRDAAIRAIRARLQPGMPE